MQKVRPFVLSIAGFDPTGGAGVLADCKTFEQNGACGLAVVTANTLQTDSRFMAPNWVDKNLIVEQARLMLENYQVKAVKIGLVEDYLLLKELVLLIRSMPGRVVIVWDPILASSSGFDFHRHHELEIGFIEKNIDLVTPNLPEFTSLFGAGYTVATNNRLSVLKKGGHDPVHRGTDVLLAGNKTLVLEGTSFSGKTKHGTGCILSAAICAGIARDLGLEAACEKAKRFVEKVILSNDSNLGYFADL